MPNSQSFTLKYDGRASVLMCECSVALAFDPNDAASTAAAKLHQLRAIWDTGATNTCISSEAAMRIGLVATGQAVTSTGNGDVRASTYLVNIGLPNRVGLVGVRVTGLPGIRGADMLIGMDIMGLGDFAVTNHDGKTVMSFRFPSSKPIDFVAEHSADTKTEAIAAMHHRHSASRKKNRKKR